MRHDFTIYHEVPSLYDPDPEAMIEVAVSVKFTIQPAEPDVGIMSSFPEDICVVETDSPLFDVDQAQAWLDGKSKEANCVIDSIVEGCSDDYRDWDHERNRRRDDLMNP